MTLRLFKDVGFTFVGRNTLQTCYVPNFGYDYETQLHGTTHTKIKIGYIKYLHIQNWYHIYWIGLKYKIQVVYLIFRPKDLKYNRSSTSTCDN